MSLDKDALQFLETRALQAQAIDGTDIPVRMVPKEVAIQSLEPYLKNRVSYRGLYQTKSILDFARYSGKFSGGSCYVDQEKMAALQFFDLGSVAEPGHGKHRALIKLQETAAFTAVRKINGNTITQRDLAEWVEDWRAYIVPYLANGDAVDVPRAVASIRRITIAAKKEVVTNQENFKGSRTALEEIEAKSEQEMFAGLRFKCIPYHGLDERSFELRLSIMTGGDEPRLVLRLVRIEEAEEAMAQEFAEKLNTALKSGGAESDIYLGSFELA